MKIWMKLETIAEGWMKIWMKLYDGNIPQKDKSKMKT
jgi:hypothetical protein